jgi:hypothetical protein
VGVNQNPLGAYVYSISSLPEKACGAQSGWVYLVNGVQPSQSCSNYVLQDGDRVQWRYTVTPGDV